MNNEVFLDTGVFVAFLVEADRAHLATRSLFEKFPAKAITSLAVLCEAYAYFLHRFGEDQARTFRATVAALPVLKLLPLDARHHLAVCRKLDRFRGLKLTYVDASSLVFIAERKINTVWGTDADLTIEGARLLPD